VDSSHGYKRQSWVAFMTSFTTHNGVKFLILVQTLTLVEWQKMVQLLVAGEVFTNGSNFCLWKIVVICYNCFTWMKKFVMVQMPILGESG
jgi:hypothetical protein